MVVFSFPVFPRSIGNFVKYFMDDVLNSLFRRSVHQKIQRLSALKIVLIIVIQLVDFHCNFVPVDFILLNLEIFSMHKFIMKQKDKFVIHRSRAMKTFGSCL